MNYLEYVRLAVTTNKSHHSIELAICDWTLGICGEVGEVLSEVLNPDSTKMQLAKELGDVLWYGVALMNECKLDIPEDLLNMCNDLVDSGHCATCEVLSTLDVTHHMIMTAHNISEHIKHVIMHHEELPEKKLVTYLGELVFDVARIAHSKQFDVFMVAELNIAKLRHRYSTGSYSNEASANRHKLEQRFEDTDAYKLLKERIENANNC